ncbi:hypothetical protein PR048_005832 [Dryococelus australis]|uniref:Uncharacterized protein n=1 Tax=Dryococelus australis TaxID=614101 RepID=A0ABQ9IBF7_9NEOP|nr:hypothetical protein PR048_005832 [Dryococelus australis]
MFYATQHKVRQDDIILRFTQTSLTKRKHNFKDYYEKDVSAKYYLPKKVDNNAHNQVRVCKQMFLSVLKISKRRVEEVCKMNFSIGNAPEDNRGNGVRDSRYVDKKAAFRAIIEKLQSV